MNALTGLSRVPLPLNKALQFINMGHEHRTYHFLYVLTAIVMYFEI
jgi:hypothetical protein